VLIAYREKSGVSLLSEASFLCSVAGKIISLPSLHEHQEMLLTPGLADDFQRTFIERSKENGTRPPTHNVSFALWSSPTIDVAFKVEGGNLNVPTY
jgi:hypothetical protein